MRRVVRSLVEVVPALRYGGNPLMIPRSNLFVPGTPQDRGYRVGRLVSQVFHPISLNVVTLLMIGFFLPQGWRVGFRWAVLCILLEVMPPTVFFLFRLRQGAYSDEDVSVRQQRTELYVVGFVWVLCATALLVFLGIPQAFLACLVSTLVLGLVGGLINLMWKISVHSAAIASTATMMLFYSRGLGIGLWVCALMVGWARVRTSNHTLAQVLAGFGCAAVIVVCVFTLVGVRG